MQGLRHRLAGGAGALARRGAWPVAALVFLAGLVLLRLWDPLIVETVRLRTFDVFQQLRPRVATGFPVVIVDIDERSLAELGQWQWPRTLVAALTAKLIEAGVVAVAYDILFAEADRLSPGNVARSREDLPSAVSAALERLPDNDARMAETISRLPVVLAEAGLPSRVGADGRAPRRVAVAEIGGDPRPYLIGYEALVRNLPVLEAASHGIGIISLTGERDNVVRRVPAVYRVGKAIYPSLAVELLRVATGARAFAVRTNEAGVDSVIVSRVRIPTDRTGQIWVRFAPPDARRYISAVDILKGRHGPRALAGRLAIIGTSAVGLHDIKSTPLSAGIPGVEVHAQSIETILSKAYLVRPNYAIAVELAVLVAVGIAILMLVTVLGAWWTLAIGTLLAAAMLGASWYAFAAHGLLIDVTFPAGGAFALYSMLIFRRFAHEQAGRRQIRAAFARYLSPEVVARLAEDPRQLVLGGQDKQMTILFTDVQGFTAIAETLDATGLTNLVNRLLTPVTAAILERGGTVDKYMGDAVMAFWNAPLDDAEHARHACLSALDIQAAIGPLNRELAAEAGSAGRSFKPLKVGVGVNTGECCVGNMGSEMRFDYSVLGDTVNIAARLEGLTRQYRVGVVVGEDAAGLAPGLAFVELDLVRVVGRDQPIRIFTLLGDEALGAEPRFRELDAAHAAMLAAYRGQDWPAAQAALSACREEPLAASLGGLYDLFAERIADYEADPPPPGWDGVHVSETKH